MPANQKSPPPGASPSPTISVERGVTVVVLGPDCENLGEVKLDMLRDRLIGVADKADPPRVVVDLSNVKFFGSSFIEILFGLWNKLEHRPGGALALCALTPYCAEVLSVTHLDSLWRAYPDRRTAVDQLAAGSGQL